MEILKLGIFFVLLGMLVGIIRNEGEDGAGLGIFLAGILTLGYALYYEIFI